MFKTSAGGLKNHVNSFCKGHKSFKILRVVNLKKFQGFENNMEIFGL